MRAAVGTGPVSSPEEVRLALERHPTLDAEDKERAARVLERMTRAGGESHSRLNMRESEALDIVWRRLCQIEDPTVRHSAIETLGKQLASGVESGFVVCSTGRIARAVTALDGVLESQDPARPLWALREELATLAAQTREDVLRAAAPDARAAYESGGEGSDALSSAMALEFSERVDKTYVEGLEMRPEVLGPLVEEMEAAF
jgi:hypothetical protein